MSEYERLKQQKEDILVRESETLRAERDALRAAINRYLTAQKALQDAGDGQLNEATIEAALTATVEYQEAHLALLQIRREGPPKVAQPDAGDVALQIAYSSTLTHANELLDKLHTAEAECDALAAEVATLRGALEFAVGVRSLAADRALTLPTVRGILNDVTKAAKRALATPSPAAERVRAVIDAAREVIPVASLPSVLRVAQVPMQVIADLDAALRALGGDA